MPGSCPPSGAGRSHFRASMVGRLFLSRRSFGDFQPSPTPHLLGWRRHRDLQNSVLEGGLRLIAHDALWKRDHAIELAITPLRAIHALALLLMFPLAFALN